MPGIRAFRKIQLGRETTPGTAVAATTLWRGQGTIEDDLEVKYIEEDVGYLGGLDRTLITKVGGILELEPVAATYEQLPHILEMGIMTATPVQDGSGSGRIYTYNFPTTTVPTIKTYTAEGGDNQEAERMAYTFAEQFTLEGEAEDSWMMSATLRGRQVAANAFTGAIGVPVVEDMAFQKTKLYIDVIGGTWGSTQKSDTLLAAALEYDTGMEAVWAANGDLFFSFAKNVGPEVVLNVTFEHDGTATAEKAFWRSQTPRLIQLKNEGAALTSAGTTYTNRTMIINLAGKWTNFDKISERNGNDVIEAEFTARYNLTGAKFGQIIVVNDLTALP